MVVGVVVLIAGRGKGTQVEEGKWAWSCDFAFFLPQWVCFLFPEALALPANEG